MTKYIKSSAIFVALVASLALAGCGDKEPKPQGDAITPQSDAPTKEVKKSTAAPPIQKLANSYFSEMDKMAEALESVTDQASAEKAAATIAQVNANLEKLIDEAKKESSELSLAALAISQQEKFVAVQTRVTSAMTTLALNNPALMAGLAEAISKTPQ